MPLIYIGKPEEGRLTQHKDSYRSGPLHDFEVKRESFYPSQTLYLLNPGKKYANSEEEVKRIFNNQTAYFDLLRQSFDDLNETRTAELRLLELTQKGSIPEYLTKFT
jgi:hypothetical protein